MVPPLVLGHGFSSFVRRKRSDRRSAVDQVFISRLTWYPSPIY